MRKLVPQELLRVPPDVASERNARPTTEAARDVMAIRSFLRAFSDDRSSPTDNFCCMRSLFRLFFLASLRPGLHVWTAFSDGLPRLPAIAIKEILITSPHISEARAFVLGHGGYLRLCKEEC